MGNAFVQPSFTSGELSPSLYGRIDFAKYYTGLKTCRNMIVRQFGGVCNRPGTRFVGEVIDSANVTRLIPFEFSTEQTYVLEFGNKTIRIIRNGGVVVWPSGEFEGEPVEIETLWTSDDLALLKFTQSNDVMTICHPDYPIQQLSRTDHHLWSLSSFNNIEGPFQDINVDSSITIRSSAITGNVTVTASQSLFSSANIGQLLYIEQSPDSQIKKWEVQKVITVNDIRRAGSSYYQALNTATTGTVRPDHIEGAAYDGDPGVSWQYLHSGFGIIKLTGFTSATVMTGTVLNRLPDSVVTGTQSRTITGVVEGTNAVVTCPAHGFSSGDSVTVAGVVGMEGINGAAQIITIDANSFELSGVYGSGVYKSGGTAAKTLTGANSYKWAFEAWGGDQSYPSVTTYFQQRQMFGNSYGKPQTIWLSRTAGFTDFGTSIPILDDDSISISINSRRAINIKHFVELGDMIVLTSDGPFLLRGTGDNGVLVPGAVLTKRQGSSGASDVPPVVVNNQALYIQEVGGQVRSLGYDFANDAFIGSDLTVLSNHLFKTRKIIQWAYQSVPFSCVWAVRSDGALLGFTYMPEHEVAGWHRHDTDGFFESVCCIQENGADVVYFIVRRTIGGVTKRYIEKMASRDFDSQSDYFFVDSGLSYDGEPATVFSGLNHLEWKTVSILADGNVHEQRVVSGGAVTLDYAASVVHIGLPFTSDFETLDLASAQNDIRDKKKIINHVAMIVEETRGINVGADPDHLVEIKPRSNENYTDPANVINGLVETNIQCTWSRGGRIFIRQSDPLPITILAVIPEVTVGGSR